MKSLIRSLLFSLAPLCALAGSYPEKPIRLVVGFPSGGGVDLVARQFSGHLAKALGQPVNVENVLGEAGNKASREVAAAAPDGYTVMIVNPANIAINPSLYPNLGFDPQKAFTPVARMVVTPLMALIPASLSPQNMEEFITRLRTQKSLKYTSGGVGNINQLAVELFKIKSNTRLTHVPAKNSAAALVELIEGRAQMMTDGGHVAGEHIRAGRIRALAVFAEQRLASLPDVPTAAEVGLPGLVVSSWLGLVAPAGTPEPVVARLRQAVAAVLAQPEFAAELTNQGTQPALLTGDGFREFILAEQQRWAEVVKTSGVKLE
jgi:tripartite-type tricarboxylate transporter receptor subunit TctC